MSVNDCSYTMPVYLIFNIFAYTHEIFYYKKLVQVIHIKLKSLNIWFLRERQITVLITFSVICYFKYFLNSTHKPVCFLSQLYQSQFCLFLDKKKKYLNLKNIRLSSSLIFYSDFIDYSNPGENFSELCLVNNLCMLPFHVV